MFWESRILSQYVLIDSIRDRERERGACVCLCYPRHHIAEKSWQLPRSGGFAEVVALQRGGGVAEKRGRNREALQSVAKKQWQLQRSCCVPKKRCADAEEMNCYKLS